MKVNKDKIKQATKMLLEAIGEDCERPGLIDTPDRVSRMWEEFLGKHEEYKPTTFPAEGNSSLVLTSSIPFYSFCEHHILPFFGYAYVGYLPDENIIGLSKIDRIVAKHASKLQNQERITEHIGDEIRGFVSPHVGVYLEARHMCKEMRGITSHKATTATSYLLGNFAVNQTLKAEFLSIIQANKKDI